jgi:hypothetical protein
MVVPPKKFDRLLDSWMAHMGYVVGQLDQLSAKADIARHDDPLSSIVQKPILHVPSVLKVQERGQVLQMLQETGS